MHLLHYDRTLHKVDIGLAVSVFLIYMMVKGKHLMVKIIKNPFDQKIYITLYFEFAN
jgi:hypothetical protein